MKTFHPIAFALMWAFMGVATADVPGYGIATTGEHHGAEVAAKDGETWWGLYPGKDSSFALEPVVVSVTTVVDELMDGPGEKPTGKLVRAHGPVQPWLLIKGLKDPKPGPLPGKLSPQAVKPGKPYAIALENCAPITITANGQPEPASPYVEATLRAYTLSITLKDQPAQTLLHRDIVGEYGCPTVQWVGDIDRDGLPDLVLDISDHENVGDLALYLSSERKLGDHVRLVARYRTTGC